MAFSYSSISLLAAAILAFAAYRLFFSQNDEREPPYVRPTLPFVGHLLNMVLRGSDYFKKLDDTHGRPIYTLPMLNGRMYMVCSPDWVSAVYRNHKTLSFNHLVSGAMKNIFGMDRPTLEIIDRNKNGEDGTRGGLLLETHDMMGTALAPGPDLDDMTKSVINEEAKRVNRLAREGATHEIKLWSWLRQNFSMASMNALYGPENPYALNPSLLDDFWQFDAASTAFMMLPFPSVLLSGAYKARERLCDAFTEYVEKGRYKQASKFIQKRADLNLNRFKLSEDMYARGEVSMNFGALSNTIPAGFWLLTHIFADPTLLRDVRAEVDACTSVIDDDGRERAINVTQLKTNCPLFLSAFRETLRFVGSLNNARYVLEDTLVTNAHTGERYLFKKDSMIQIGTNVIHQQPSIWGPDAAFFNPGRFLHELKKPTGESTKPADPAAPFKDLKGKIHSGAFRTFGSGNSICLGRHFAQSEVMALVAVFVAGFEIVDRGEENGLSLPLLPKYKVPMGGVLHPVADVEVDIRRRAGYEKVEWSFEL